MARRLAPFDVKLLVVDPYANPDALEGVELVSLDELLAQADVVSLHCALTDETRGLVAAEQLARMKPTAWLINTARGSIVDETALAKALQARQIAGAALDVFEIEPLPPNSPLLTLENVILSPHIGGAPTDVVRRHSSMIVEDVLRWQRGERPERLLNPAAWAPGHMAQTGDQV